MTVGDVTPPIEGMPSWLVPPRLSGWEVDDLDQLPEDVRRHVELLDGALIVMLAQRSWHDRVIRRLADTLEQLVPDAAWTVETQMTVALDSKSAPEPDVVVASVPYDPERTRFAPSDVVLAVEVVSEESHQRDREYKPFKYARARIPYFWRVEDERGQPVVHTYELDETTLQYVATGIHRGTLNVAAPVMTSLDLSTLAR
ncbi:Uma2 family endonuclease [Streptomyces sp. G5(2025)]|uniref:Uma2 family endonuclease n=1 Tax=Streptomyces sp. G5(2025) TaxID=3406628 RepID=UPI003C17A288